MADDSNVLAVIRSILSQLDEINTQAVEAIKAAPATTQTFTAATELADHLRRLGEAGADLRSHVAGRIWSAERLSLAGLADRIGVSKARADQLIRNAKKLAEAETSDKDPD